MKQNRRLEDYVDKQYLFIGTYATYNERNKSRVIKKIHFEDEDGNIVKIDHFNIYSNQFDKDTVKFRKSEKGKQVLFYGTIDTYSSTKKENGIDYCVKDVIVIR